MSSDAPGPPELLPSLPSPTQARLDWLADFVIPACVFGLLGSLLYFLIDLRQYVAGGEAAILRYVVFWLLVGVIGLSRLAARPGLSEIHPIAYALALGAAVAFATVVLEGEGQAAGVSAGGHRNLGTVISLLTVAGIWAAAWLLTGLCTRLERALEELRSGGMALRPGALQGTATPLRAILLLTAVAVALFSYGLARVEAGHPLWRHAYWCASLYLFFALALMALVSLGAARLSAQAGQMRVNRWLIPAWATGGALLALIILLVAAALPGVASRLKPRQPGVGPAAYAGDEEGRWRGVRRGWSDQPGPGPKGRRFGPSGAERWPGEKRRSGGEGATRGPGGIGPWRVAEAVAQALAAIPPLVWLVLGVMVLMAISWWQRRQIAAAFRALAALLARVLAWMGRLVGPRGDAVAPGELPRDPWADIFAGVDPATLDPATAVRHVWRAVQLFYLALGVSRADHETEMEFARRAPGVFGLRPEHVRRVAVLYDACEYGGYLPAKGAVAEMAEIWRILLRAAGQMRERAA